MTESSYKLLTEKYNICSAWNIKHQRFQLKMGVGGLKAEWPLQRLLHMLNQMQSKEKNDWKQSLLTSSINKVSEFESFEIQIIKSKD